MIKSTGNRPTVRRVAGLLAVVTLATVFGCRPAASGTVTGTVRYQSNAVTAGLVTFHGRDGQQATAEIQPDGTYKAAEVPLGAVQVTVRGRPAAVSGMEKRLQNMKRGSFKPADTPAVALPKQYAKPDQSPLSLTVKAGPQPFDIDLQ
jgi:hypothetical protein